MRLVSIVVQQGRAARFLANTGFTAMGIVHHGDAGSQRTSPSTRAARHSSRQCATGIGRRCSAGSSGSSGTVITSATVAQHASPSECWTTISGRV